jgi:8-oxo-dGTP pyrophosphatase MutT (NUDIX family)
VRDAATVMLVRDAPDAVSPRLEVLVLRRTPDAVFGPGATVFPGGAVDAADFGAEHVVVGLDDRTASAEHGLVRGGLALRVAAARECFEESGVLLARDPATGDFADPKQEWRDDLNDGRVTFAELLAREQLHLDARDLRLFAHWRTPIGPPRRYDTWFFVAVAPVGHVAAHDDVELVHSAWVSPRSLLRAGARGDVDLILPTARSLAALARFDSVDALTASLDAVPRAADGCPAVVDEVSGQRIVLPGDIAASEASVPGTPERRWRIPLPDLHYRDESRLAGEAS